jgi:hypothetical protein
MNYGKRVLFSILFFLFAQFSFGQSKLTLVPSLGMAFPGASALSPYPNDPGFKPHGAAFFPSLELGLQYTINENWILFGGWRASDDTGFQMKYGTREADLREGRFAVSGYTSRIPVGAMRHLTTQRWIKVKRRVEIMEKISASRKTDMLYLVLFRLRAVGGISYNYRVPMTDDNEWIGFSSGIYRLGIENRHTASVFGGLNLQFFNFDRDHFQFSIIYSQGLQTVLDVEINYQLLSGEYETRLRSKGSYLALQLAYPIGLKGKKQ